MRKALLVTTAITTLWMAAPAFAEDATASADGAATPEAGISEIIVTAQRRVESAQKAAIAIDAVKGDDLLQRGIGSASDITGM